MTSSWRGDAGPPGWPVVGEPLQVAAGPLAVGLTTALRRAGLPAPPERSVGLARALRLVPPPDRAPLYWTCRVALVTDRAQLPTFDAVFSAVFDGLLDPADSRGDPTAPPSIGSEPRTRPARHEPSVQSPPGSGSGEADLSLPGSEGEGGDAQREVLLAVASAEERLRHTSFAELTPDELAGVRRLVRDLVPATPLRRSRRTRPVRSGGERLDLRRTGAGAAGT